MRDNGPITGRAVEVPPGELIVSSTDLRGTITYANEAFIRISGYSRDELLGKPHNLLRHPDMPPAAFADLWNTVKAGQCWVGMVKNRCRNGDHYWVRAAVSPMRRDDAVTGFISIRMRGDPAEVAAAESAYYRIRGGAGGLAVLRGRVVSDSLLAGTLRWLGQPAVMVRLALLATAALAGAAAWAGRDETAVAACAGATAALALLLAWLVPRAMRTGIRRLGSSLERLAVGDFTEDLPLGRSDDLGAALITIEGLRTRLAYASTAGREHELRMLAGFDRELGEAVAKLLVAGDVLRAVA